MAQQMIDNKIAALSELHNRVIRIVERMGGTAFPFKGSVGLQSAAVAAPRVEGVPALRAEMPDGFLVDFTPTNPMGLGNALTVKAERTHNGGRKNDMFFSFGPGGWQRGSVSLSDEEIRECLTPGGPPAVN